MARSLTARRLAARRFWSAAALLVLVSAAGVATAGRSSGVSGRASGAVVEAIFPTADRLPANLLRLYIVFSEPMSIGESHAHLRLTDEAGRVIPGAFLELEDELWDPSRRRLTVLLDPGRIKRGLRANLESGAPLEAGRRYRLEVDAAWRDGAGRPLCRGAVKAFEAIDDDRSAPEVEAWTIAAPEAGTRAPLTLRFPEPLDRALLASAIAVEDEHGERVDGSIDTADGERMWTLTPDQVWTPGRYTVRVADELEDVAGNNLRHVFDVDLTQAARPATPVLTRAFTIVNRSES